MGTRNPYTYQLIALPDGDFLYFSRISKGGGYGDAVFRHDETSSAFYGAVTRWDGQGWETKLRDGSMIHFPESYNAKNMAQGAPTVMVDAQGRTLQLLRDGERNLKEIRSPGGRWIKLAHDDRGRIVRATDDEGRIVRYVYDSGGMLAEVQYADGQQRRYAYEGALLTHVRDEQGRLLIRNWYDRSSVVQQEYANGQRYRFRYELGDNRAYAKRAMVELPDGSMRSVLTAHTVPQLVKDIKR